MARWAPHAKKPVDRKGSPPGRVLPWPEKGMVARGGDPRKVRLWVVPSGKPPRSAEVLAEGEGNLEGREGRQCIPAGDVGPAAAVGTLIYPF